MFDFIGKTTLFSINYFKESVKISNKIKFKFNTTLVNSLSWYTNSEILFISYENKNSQNFGIKKLELHFENPENQYTIIEKDIIIKNSKIKDARLCSNVSEDDVLLISGENPEIYHINSNSMFNFFKREINTYTFLLKETFEINSFFLFVKELYLIILLKDKSQLNLTKYKFLMENLNEKKLNTQQLDAFDWIKENLCDNMIIVDSYGLNVSGEIINVQLNTLKSLILVNSSDKNLRLFKYDFDNITLLREYNDSVNRKKWVNAHFYTFKIKNTFQDLILAALSDINSLEFIFIDIETGNFVKRLEPYKYQCSEFICHYINHFSIVILSSKKLFNISGFLINNWSTFAPQFKYIEENVEFIEDEAFFDNFNIKLKKKQSEVICNKELIKGIFSCKTERTQNLFFNYLCKDDDTLAIQSEKDLRDVFQQFGQIMEFNK